MRSLRCPVWAIGTLIAACLPLHAEPVDILPTNLRGAVQPQLAVAPDGRVHVVFGKDNAIYHSSSPDGRKFSAPVKVGELPKLALRMRRGPCVTATDRAIVVTAISHSQGNLHSWFSDDGGTSWKETPRINSVANSAREGLQALAGDGRGLVFSSWLDLRHGGMELWGAVSRDSGATWEPDRLLYASPDGHICECCHPSLAISPTGQVAAMWRNWKDGSRDLYVIESADGAKSWSEARKLGKGTWPLQGCPMDGGSIAFAPGGKPEATWRRETSVFLSETPADELRLGANAKQPVIAFGKTGRTIVWENNGNLLLQRPAATSPNTFAEKATMPAIASRPAEEPVVAWESSSTNPPTILIESLP